MKVLPVLDLMAGQVVHAVAGERARYRPLAEAWIGTSDPVGVARALEREYGLREFYVADLDGIVHQQIQWTPIRALLDAGYQLWLDVGWQTAQQLNDAQPALVTTHAQGSIGSRPADQLRWVLGTESLASAVELGTLAQILQPQRCTLSLDQRSHTLQLGRDWPRIPSIREMAEMAVAAGVVRLLVLELSRVGTGRGIGTLDLCTELRHVKGVEEIWWGGGVRSRGDLAQLAAAGVDRTLVGTALFARQITIEDLVFPRRPPLLPEPTRSSGQ